MQIEFGLMGMIGALALFFRYLWRPLVVSVKERVRGPVNIRQSCLLATLIGIFGFSLIDGLFYHVVPLLLSATLFVLFQAGRTVDNATPQGSTYRRGNSVQSNGAGSTA